MSEHKIRFFITGAIGGQGGAVARQLLSAGYHANALARDLDNPSAHNLAKAGADLIVGDFDDIEALAKAAQGCTGVFLNTSPDQPFETELQHAQYVINASKSAGMTRIACATVTRCEQFPDDFPSWMHQTPFIGYWTTKAAVQRAATDAGFQRWTILQPAFVMTNWIAP
ncbi:hypothetical protein LTS18_006729, partial [Coniosporium uncinatum]